MELPPGSVDALTAIVGRPHVVTDPERNEAATVDWTGRFRGSTPAVVRPGSVDEVAAVMTHCHAAGIVVVPQGGNTGLVAGGVPLHDEVVLDLRRLDSIGDVDPLARQVTVGAGTTVADVQRAAGDAGLAYAVDFAARDSATIGGTIATNAGGVHVMRWGTTRRQVVGLEAVLADGRVIRRLAGLEKDNTGYDLTGLICGSEGTLAVVTAARLRLVPDEPAVAVALVGFESVDDAVAAVARLRADLPGLSAAELMLDDGIELVCAQFGRRHPLPDSSPVLVLLEARGGDPEADLGAAIGADALARDSAVVHDSASRAALWSYRDDHTLAINALGAPHKLDVTVPLPRVAAFVPEVRARVAAVAPRAQVWLFGHLGDGNIHVNVTGIDPRDEAVDDAVLGLVAEIGGSISAEHGIGAAKRRWLHLSRSPAELSVFRAIKAALDPRGILNPHVLLPDQPPNH
jgi:FAD/FMN-containing dehydrogenase